MKLLFVLFQLSRIDRVPDPTRPAVNSSVDINSLVVFHEFLYYVVK